MKNKTFKLDVNHVKCKIDVTLENNPWLGGGAFKAIFWVKNLSIPLILDCVMSYCKVIRPEFNLVWENKLYEILNILDITLEQFEARLTRFVWHDRFYYWSIEGAKWDY